MVAVTDGSAVCRGSNKIVNVVQYRMWQGMCVFICGTFSAITHGSRRTAEPTYCKGAQYSVQVVLSKLLSKLLSAQYAQCSVSSVLSAQLLNVQHLICSTATLRQYASQITVTVTQRGESESDKK